MIKRRRDASDAAELKRTAVRGNILLWNEKSRRGIPQKECNRTTIAKTLKTVLVTCF